MADAKNMSFLFGCELTAAKKEFTFEEEDDPNMEHHLLLQTVCLGAGAADEFHSVSVEALDHAGKMLTVPLVSLKPSVQPSVSLSGFELAPPVVLRLTAGAGPVHVCGQHVLTSDEMFSDEEEESEEEEECEEPVVVPARKRVSEASPAGAAQKKLKVVLGNDGKDKKPAAVTPAKAAAKNGQNGSVPATPVQTPERKPKTPDSAAKPKTPKSPLPTADIKATLKQKVEKGVGLPKKEDKFSNFIKSSFKVEDPKVLSELWAFVQTLKA